MNENLQDSELYEARFGVKERRSNTRFYVVLFLIVMAFLIFRAYWTSNFGIVAVDGTSMNRTLADGEYLLSRNVKDADDLKRGDIIVVYVKNIPEFQKDNEIAEADPDDDIYPTYYLIKRLIALEGDIVRCTKGELEICYAGTWNEEMGYENYPFVKVDEPYAYYTNKNAPQCTFEYEVKEGEVFFLGDNRNGSKDSRYEQDGFSRLDRLYKAEYITATVPEWAVENKGLYQWICKLLYP